MITRKVDHTFATVGARADIDSAVPLVVINPNRYNDLEEVEILMEPKTARRLARMLNKWAKIAEEIGGRS